ncbi:hypothetical protein ACY3DP_001655 [Listeria monocytogenes]|nr:hypothetical protein [Listeria monocytogenes]EAE5958280.1 hypothetical protein [Listeria monocytogenes]EAE6032109.1 hypothetical protein [Listeria monocytogenes]EAE6059415.1 hypothetical protein [Listeria monocytogenes]EAF0355923.1 hypothetical protein [Listeria monocytogenes]
MRENTNDRERAAYNQQIMEKESQLDKMKENRKEVENSLYQLDEDFRRGFHQLRMLSDENIREVQTGIFQEDQRNEELERGFQQKVQVAKEQFSHVFQKEIHRIDDEREELYKQRSEIPWD